MALRNSPKENVEGFSSNDFLLGQPIRISGDFFDKSFDTDIPNNPDSIVTKFGHYVKSLRFMPPRENKRKSYLEKSSILAGNHLCLKIEMTVIAISCSLIIESI